MRSVEICPVLASVSRNLRHYKNPQSICRDYSFEPPVDYPKGVLSKETLSLCTRKLVYAKDSLVGSDRGEREIRHLLGKPK